MSQVCHMAVDGTEVSAADDGELERAASCSTSAAEVEGAKGEACPWQ